MGVGGCRLAFSVPDVTVVPDVLSDVLSDGPIVPGVPDVTDRDPT
jgi:hypothetical protein